MVSMFQRRNITIAPSLDPAMAGDLCSRLPFFCSFFVTAYESQIPVISWFQTTAVARRCGHYIIIAAYTGYLRSLLGVKQISAVMAP